MRMVEQLIHMCLHKTYLREFFEKEILRVLAELNVIEVTRIACLHMTTRDFHSSLNRIVPYLGITKVIHVV